MIKASTLTCEMAPPSLVANFTPRRLILRYNYIVYLVEHPFVTILNCVRPFDVYLLRPGRSVAETSLSMAAPGLHVVN